jgi:putative membrane protein
VTNGELLRSWDADPIVLAFGAAAVGVYGYSLRLRLSKRAWFFGAAVALFVVALLSPIDVLARGYLFSAHMLQHLLLLLVVPPLVLLALPPAEARATGRSKARLKPIVAWGLGVGAMWMWHAPVMCNAAARSVGIQHLQTLSLLAMGGAYWWPILSPIPSRRLEPFAAILYLFAACIACTILGIIVTFSPVSVCNAFAHPMDPFGALALVRDQWGITAKSDQEIGGLLMWVPTCVVYTSAILGMLGRYYGGERRPAREEAIS